MNSVFNQELLNSCIKQKKVTFPEKYIGYFLGPFLALISNAILASYLNRYYSDIVGWTNQETFGAFSALLPIVSVIFVIIGNLVLGRLIDTTRTKQGKARPYLLLSAILISVALLSIFCIPLTTNATFQMFWIAVSYNLYYAIAYPFFYTSHSSLVSLSTRDAASRGLLATLSNAAGVAAVGLGASILVPMFLQNYLFVEENGVLDVLASYQNWRSVIVILCVVTLIGILLEYFFTRERVTEEEIQNQLTKVNIVPLKQQINGCLSNRYWWLIIAYFLIFQLGGLVKNGSMSYYSRWMFDGVTTEAEAGNAMGMLGLIGGIPTALGMVIAWPIANKFGKQKAIIIGLIFSILGGMVSFLDVHNFLIVCTGIVLKGIGSIPAMYVTLALLSDVLDYLERKNGFRSDGFTMSVYGAIMVGMAGLGNGLINLLLSIAGYNPSLASQSSAVSNMLVFCYLIAELICYVVLVFLLMFLTVEKENKNQASA